MKYFSIITTILIYQICLYSQETSYVSFENQQVFETISILASGYFIEKDNLTILLNTYPVKGVCDQRAYDSLHVIFKHILSKYGTVFSSSNEALEEMLQNDTSRYDIIFVIFEVSYESTGKSGVPFVIPLRSGMIIGSGSGYIHFENIRFVAIEPTSRKIVWDYTLQKYAGWFSGGSRARTNEITELGRLSNRVGFNEYGKRGIFKLNEALRKFFIKHSRSKKTRSHRLH